MFRVPRNYAAQNNNTVLIKGASTKIQSFRKFSGHFLGHNTTVARIQ